MKIRFNLGSYFCHLKSHSKGAWYWRVVQTPRGKRYQVVSRPHNTEVNLGGMYDVMPGFKHSFLFKSARKAECFVGVRRTR